MGITICYFFIYFVEAIIALLYSSNVFNTKTKTFTRILSLTILYASLFAISFSENFMLNTMSFLLANFIFIFSLYQCKWHLALFHATILTVSMGFSELVVYSLMSHFAPDFFGQNTYFRNLALLTVFSKILYYIITLILSQTLGKQHKTYQVNNKTSFYLIVVPIISVYVMLTLFAICVVAKLNATLDLMISISALLLLLINLFVFAIHSHNQKRQAEFTELQLLLQRDSDFSEYYKMLVEQLESQKILVHDIKQHLQSIAILNEKREHDKIQLYLSQLELSSNLRNGKVFCEHTLLNTILNRYHQKCDEKSVTFSVDVRSNVMNFMTSNDITALFCNLLDNALESAVKTDNGYIEMEIMLQPDTPFTLLTMKNSCRKSPFSGDKLISEKKNRSQHGFGMKSIQRIVTKYCGEIKTYYNTDTTTFHTIITLKNNN